MIPVDLLGAKILVPARYTGKSLVLRSDCHSLSKKPPMIKRLFPLAIFLLLTACSNEPPAAIAQAEKAKESAAPKPAVPPAPPQTVESAGICEGLDLAITSDQSECASRKFKVADKKLNEDYAALMTALPPARKAELKREQIGWIKEKTAKCEQAGKEFEGGSLQPIIIVDCEVNMTEQRTRYLADFK